MTIRTLFIRLGYRLEDDILDDHDSESAVVCLSDSVDDCFILIDGEFEKIEQELSSAIDYHNALGFRKCKDRMVVNFEHQDQDLVVEFNQGKLNLMTLILIRVRLGLRVTVMGKLEFE